jgi:hypothetical protein
MWPDALKNCETGGVHVLYNSKFEQIELDFPDAQVFGCGEGGSAGLKQRESRRIAGLESEFRRFIVFCPGKADREARIWSPRNRCGQGGSTIKVYGLPDSYENDVNLLIDSFSACP